MRNRTGLKLECAPRPLHRIIALAGAVAAGIIYATAAAATQPPALQEPPMPAWQKAAGGKAAFEVASIKLAEPGTFRPPNFDMGIEDTADPPGGHLFADFPLAIYIEFAYKIMPTREQQDAMLAQLPKWVRDDRFVIQAETEGNPTKDQVRLMMQSLLADRFHLKVHFETPTEPVLALVLIRRGKLGPRIQPHAQGLPCDAKWTAPPDRSSPSVAPGGFMPACGPIQAINGSAHTVLLGSRNATVEQIADYLSILTGFDRPVVDQTGLTGRFDFTLQWTPERNGPPASDAGAQLNLTGPTLFEALKDQFAMKLKPTKAPIRILVIDHVEPPSPD